MQKHGGHILHYFIPLLLMVLEGKLVILVHSQLFIRCNSKVLNLQALCSHQQTHWLQSSKTGCTMIHTMASIIQTIIITGLPSLRIQNLLNISLGDGNARAILVWLLNSLMKWRQTLEQSTATSLTLCLISYPLQMNIEMSKALLTGSGLMQSWHQSTMLTENQQ